MLWRALPDPQVGSQLEPGSLTCAVAVNGLRHMDVWSSMPEGRCSAATGKQACRFSRKMACLVHVTPAAHRYAVHAVAGQ